MKELLPLKTYPVTHKCEQQTYRQDRTDFFRTSSLSCVGDRPLRALAQ